MAPLCRRLHLIPKGVLICVEVSHVWLLYVLDEATGGFLSWNLCASVWVTSARLSALCLCLCLVWAPSWDFNKKQTSHNVRRSFVCSAALEWKSLAAAAVQELKAFTHRWLKYICRVQVVQCGNSWWRCHTSQYKSKSVCLCDCATDLCNVNLSFLLALRYTPRVCVCMYTHRRMNPGCMLVGQGDCVSDPLRSD